MRVSLNTRWIKHPAYVLLPRAVCAMVGTRPARVKSHSNVQRLIKEEKNDEAVGPVTSRGEVMTGRSGGEEHA